MEDVVESFVHAESHRLGVGKVKPLQNELRILLSLGLVRVYLRSRQDELEFSITRKTKDEHESHSC